MMLKIKKSKHFILHISFRMHTIFVDKFQGFIVFSFMPFHFNLVAFNFLMTNSSIIDAKLLGCSR